MSREVQFSFDTESDKADFSSYAKAKGMTLPALVKYATYQYRARYPLTAAEATGEKRKPGRPRKILQTVQTEFSGASESEEGIPYPKPDQDSSLAACAQGINSNSQDKTKTVSTPVASQLFHRIEKGFLDQNGGRFSDYAKEGRCINAIIKRAKNRDPENYEALALSVCVQFLRLKRDDPRPFWRDQPALPSGLAPLWDRVLETMRKPVVDQVALSVVEEGLA